MEDMRTAGVHYDLETRLVWDRGCEDSRLLTHSVSRWQYAANFDMFVMLWV
jgi:hypothetical protein